MPAIRTHEENATVSKFFQTRNMVTPRFPVGDTPEDLAICLFHALQVSLRLTLTKFIGDIEYPLDPAERVSFRTKAGRVCFSQLQSISRN